MTVDAEAGVRLPAVCPFVAFADERDLRAAEPDHRHRCYAESPPAPRAIAHQSRYCLSPTFTGCPIFQDWAAREAARISDAPAPAMPPPDGGFFDEPVAADREAFGGASAAGTAGAASASPHEGPDDDDPGGGSAEDEDAGFNAAPASREWERVRPRRDYPRLGRSRRTSPVLIALVLLAVAAVAVFFLPSVLRGLLGGGTAASPTATASGSGSVAPTGSATAVPSPTATPGPTQLIYVVKSGDTLTRIADQFDVTVEQILAANPEITNPNNISVGQQIVIPTATPAPGASVSESPPP
jgi:nucleoid-associated protein YgaU